MNQRRAAGARFRFNNQNFDTPFPKSEPLHSPGGCDLPPPSLATPTDLNCWTCDFRGLPENLPNSTARPTRWARRLNSSTRLFPNYLYASVLRPSEEIALFR